ncbi:MAG: recombinase family protein, partial [Pseudomonadota bacterium]|nr:recombinase family protein [Pseudomonadota bacterium]
LEFCMQRGLIVHIAKQRLVLDGSMQARIIATVLGLAGEIEREYIALRTREALARRRAEGQVLGRPRGPAPRVKLDAREAEIRGYLAKGISKRSMARLLGCAPSTLYAWFRRRRIAVRNGRGPA